MASPLKPPNALVVGAVPAAVVAVLFDAPPNKLEDGVAPVPVVDG